MSDDMPDVPDELKPDLEWKLRAIAIPAALVVAFLFNISPVGHLLQRTFLSMIPHELGHAITAWFCGFAALPTLWKTMIPESRGFVMPAVIVAASAFVAWRGWTTDRMWLVAIGLAMGVALFVGCTCEMDTAMTAFTFGGDAGAMIIGTALMLAFFAPEGSKVRLGMLRWGFLVIGAAAYVDVGMVWWRARTDESAIPFGVIEGVGLSDPAKLLETGWEPSVITHRYMLVAGACMAVLVAVWAWQTWSMRERASDKPRIVT
ncbi:MAG TPA: hypothetical protein VGM90_14460 [Kofleriaceae bacterium]